MAAPNTLASSPGATSDCPTPVKRPFNSPLPKQRPPPLDFSDKKLHNDQPSRPTTGDITTNKLITVRLYSTLDLSMPMPTNEHRALVIFDKSEDSLPLTNSESTRSTTPNPKRVKYEITGHQLSSWHYEKVLHHLDSSDAKTIEGSLSASSVHRRLTPPPIHGSPRQMEHSDDEKEELTLEGLQAQLLALKEENLTLGERVAEQEL
jgi:hypothetical protein